MYDIYLPIYHTNYITKCRYMHGSYNDPMGNSITYPQPKKKRLNKTPRFRHHAEGTKATSKGVKKAASIRTNKNIMSQPWNSSWEGTGGRGPVVFHERLFFSKKKQVLLKSWTRLDGPINGDQNCRAGLPGPPMLGNQKVHLEEGW